MITADTAAAFDRTMAAGGVAIFGADTVYGLACDPENAEAVERLYAIKGRRPDKPAAVMLFALEPALAALPDLGPSTVAALEGLLPGAVTLLLPNPERRFPLACGPDPETLGLRVPALGPATTALAGVRSVVMQSSANPSGGTDVRRVDEIDPAIVSAVDLVVDGGELDGIASTVIDLRTFERDGSWAVLREGALSQARVASALDGLV